MRLRLRRLFAVPTPPVQEAPLLSQRFALVQAAAAAAVAVVDINPSRPGCLHVSGGGSGGEQVALVHGQQWGRRIGSLHQRRMEAMGVTNFGWSPVDACAFGSSIFNLKVVVGSLLQGKIWPLEIPQQAQGFRG